MGCDCVEWIHLACYMDHSDIVSTVEDFQVL
jgi:hypothetical protein